MRQAVELLCLLLLLTVLGGMPTACTAAPRGGLEGGRGRGPAPPGDRGAATPPRKPPVAWILPDKAVYFAPEDEGTLTDQTSKGETGTQGAGEAASLSLSVQPIQTTPSPTTQSALEQGSAMQTEGGGVQLTEGGGAHQGEDPGSKALSDAQTLSDVIARTEAAKDKPHSRHRRFILSLLGHLFDKTIRFDEDWDEYNRPMSQYYKRRNRLAPISYPQRWQPRPVLGVFPRVPLVPNPTPKATPAAVVKPYPVLNPTFPIIGVQSDTWIWPKGDITGSLPNPGGAITNLLG